MLETDVTEVIAQRQQKFIAVEVRRAEQRIGFQHQLVMGGELLRPDLQGFRAVRKHVQVHRNLRAGIQVETAEIAAGKQRRIHQCFQRSSA